MAEKMSFMKSLITGECKHDIVLPYPKIDEDQRETVAMLLESLDRFAKDGIDGAAIDEAGKLPQEIIDQFKELGLFGLIVPEDYEGFGFSQSMYNMLMSRLSSHDASCSLLIGAHASIGFKALLLYGSEEQKQKYFPKLASGETIAAFCLTEPNSGSDAGSIQTKAEKSEDGSHYLLNGSKIWITNGGIADFFTVFARTGDKISAFIVTRDMGVKSGPPEKKMGIKGSNTTTLYFEDVKVPAENLLWEEGKGFRIAMEVLNQGRLGLSAGCVGPSYEVLKMSLEHAQKREQFGEPIFNFEMIKAKLSRMTVSAFIMDAMVYLTSGICDKKEYDYSLESAICKVFCSEQLWQNVHDALQIAGGIGYMKEYPYERIMRDARINIIFEGSNEVLRMFIALQGAKFLGNEMMAGKIEAIQSAKAELTGVDASLSEAKDVFLSGAAFLKEMTMTSVMEFQFDIVKKEYIQERIADIAIHTYAVLAGISKCQAIIEEEGADQGKHWVDLLILFVRDAKVKIERWHADFKDPSDELRSKIVQDIADNQGLLHSR
ncbi:MAG: acyl-CoA dehydrogenase family protein [Spirochaetota bacterium]|nr:acyl-CoA dehydrogenase family protein [Spirochaetota bacterium]